MACAQIMGLKWSAQAGISEQLVQPLVVAGKVSAFEQYLIITKGCRPSSLANARCILGKFERHLQGQGSACYPHQVQDLVRTFLVRFHHPAYRYTAIYYLRLFFDFLGWKENPARQVKLPKINPAQGRHFLAPEECRGLMAYFASQAELGKMLREQALFLLLLYTGIRIGEALALAWEDIAQDGTVLIRDSKTHTARIIYIPKLVWNALGQYRDTCPKGRYAFPGKSPEYPISYGVIRVAFKNILCHVGIDRRGCNLHSLRHTFARSCIQAGMRREDIQQFLGHKDIRTTEIYTRLLAEDVRQQSPLAHKAVANFISGSLSLSVFKIRKPR